MSQPTSDAADAPRWLEPHEQQVWRAYVEMQGRLNAQLNRDMLAESGLTRVEYGVLVQLSEHANDRMRVLELARGLAWEKSRLSHQLTRMQRRGLIARDNCSEDRRGAFVLLTPEGRRAVEAAAPRHVEAVRSFLFDSLSAEQIEALGTICTAIVRGLDGACEEAAAEAAAEVDAECPAVSETCAE